MARAIWSGAISFGLVNIPIKLYAAVREHSIRLHMLTPDGECRLRRKLYCPETGEEYDFKEAARGYEIAPDQYVILREEERESVEPESGRTIDITDFVSLEQIDPVYYNRPYYLVPDEHGVKGYQLLLKAMTDEQKIGIGKFVMRNKEYLAALRPMGKVIGLDTMRFADEVVSAEEELELPSPTEVNKNELEMAKRLIEALAGDFEPGRYRDEYRERLQKLIEEKAEGEEIVTQAPAEERPGKVINLMEALQKSLQRMDESQAGAAKSKPRDKKAAGKKKKKKRKSA